MIFTIGIVAHDKRITAAKRLYDEVQADVLSVDDANLRLGCEANHRRTWRALLELDADWLMVLEDDAEPVTEFRDQLGQALSVAPAPYVSLYFGRKHPVEWQGRYQEIAETTDPNICWATTGGFLMHAVGIAIRAHLVPDMLTYLDRALGRPIDEAIGQHARNTRQQIAYTLPSLVDHTDGPKIHVHQDAMPRQPGRKAWMIGTRPQWNSNTIQMG